MLRLQLRQSFIDTHIKPFIMVSRVTSGICNRYNTDYLYSDRGMSIMFVCQINLEILRRLKLLLESAFKNQVILIAN